MSFLKEHDMPNAKHCTMMRFMVSVFIVLIIEVLLAIVFLSPQDYRPLYTMKKNYYGSCDPSNDFTGIWYRWSPDGKLMSYMSYDRGVPNGVSYSFYDNGTLSSEGHYHAGLKHGRFIGWNYDRTIAHVHEYRMGKPWSGKFESVHTNGLEKELIMKNGIIVSETLSMNGVVQRRSGVTQNVGQPDSGENADSNIVNTSTSSTDTTEEATEKGQGE